MITWIFEKEKQMEEQVIKRNPLRQGISMLLAVVMVATGQKRDSPFVS
jgi:hypothetical protein